MVNYNVRPVWPDSKQPVNQRQEKSDLEDQMSSKEACKARSEAPLELGAKNFKCARRAEDGSFHKSKKVSKNAKSQREEEESIAEEKLSSDPQH